MQRRHQLDANSHTHLWNGIEGPQIVNQCQQNALLLVTFAKNLRSSQLASRR